MVRSELEFGAGRVQASGWSGRIVSEFTLLVFVIYDTSSVFRLPRQDNYRIIFNNTNMKTQPNEAIRDDLSKGEELLVPVAKLKTGSEKLVRIEIKPFQSVSGASGEGRSPERKLAPAPVGAAQRTRHALDGPRPGCRGCACKGAWNSSGLWVPDL